MNQSDVTEKIIELDKILQRQLRAGWPESWLQLNLPLGSIRALLVIEGGYANTPGGIAEVLRVGRTTVTGTLDRLESEGMITRLIDPADKRSFLLQVTEKGRALIQQVDEVRSSQLERALAIMEPEALQALSQGLEGLTEAMRIVKKSLHPVSAEKEEAVKQA
jgi:DNA-binding MarR family transcriptional regulator